MLRLLSHAPLWLLHPLGAVLGWCAFLASPSYRRRFVGNAALAGYRFASVAGAVAHAGRMVAELPRLWFGSEPRWTWSDPASVAQAYAAGRGVLFLTPHMGGFEISAQAAAADFGALHGPMTVLYRPARQPWLAELMASARQRPYLTSVPTTLTGVRGLVRALRRGEAVGLLPDQVPPDGLGLWSPFFGREAYTMTLAARLIQQTGATVVLARTERLSWGRGFVIHTAPRNGALPSELPAAVAALNHDMEQLIRQQPSQYLWGYARYKAPRVVATPALGTPGATAPVSASPSGHASATPVHPPAAGPASETAP